MKNFEKMMKQLESAFSEVDAQFIDRQITWAKERKEALIALPKTDEYIEAAKVTDNDRKYEDRFNPARFYGQARQREMRYATAGGKTWFGIFDGRPWKDIEPIVLKNCESIISNRNARIATKLEKAGVTKLEEGGFSNTKDGLHGEFSVKTNDGMETLKIETILAGGYHIQCLHLRTLINIK